MDEQLLRVDEAARVLRIGRSKAYSMASAGTLPGVIRVGGSVRVSGKALAAWIAKETAGTGGVA